MSLSRREFIQVAGGAAVGSLGGWESMSQAAQEPATPVPGAVVIASANGLGACRVAMQKLAAQLDPLDAIVQGVNVVEDDPNDHSVGYGGLPNEDGVVELDASVMHGPTHKAGAVAALQRVKNPSSVALLVMRRSDHVLLVGEGALKFARAHGFPEQNLLTDEARKIWLKWKETHSSEDDWLHPEADVEAQKHGRGGRQRSDGEGEGRGGVEFTYGTINCLARTPAGDLAGCTSTSGLAYKLAGRVGDSPIIGAGLYVDNEVGAAGSTGRGEANLQNCSSILVVEAMRAGATPQDACLQVLRRVIQRAEKRLLDDAGQPRFQLALYALRKDGVWGGAALLEKAAMAVFDKDGPRVVELPAAYPKR